MIINTLYKGFAAATVLITIAFFGLTTFASYSPTISDSNRKIAQNQTYTINWEEIKYGYDNTMHIDTLIIDEDVLHGTLTTAGGQYVYHGMVIDSQDSGVAFYYTPNTDFQGADHFKWQATLNGYYSNISSFNFDILSYFEAYGIHHNPADYPEEHGVGGGFVESTNNNGGGSINFSNPVESTNNFGGGTGGTGGGGDFLILPTDFSPAPKPALFRTGGFSL